MRNIKKNVTNVIDLNNYFVLADHIDWDIKKTDLPKRLLIDLPIFEDVIKVDSTSIEDVLDQLKICTVMKYLEERFDCPINSLEISIVYIVNQLGN